MAKYRYDRLAEELKKELSDIIMNDIKDPRIGFLSIVSVEVSGDMRHAKVFYSVLGDDKAKKDTEAAIKGCAGFIRKEISSRLTLRYTPQFSFVLDDSIEHAIHISKLIEEQKAIDKQKASQEDNDNEK